MNREEAIKKLKEVEGNNLVDTGEELEVYDELLSVALDMAIEALSAEAVQVVRCKDCKHYIVEGITTQYGWCHEYKHSVDEDDFCSYGERKGGDSE